MALVSCFGPAVRYYIKKEEIEPRQPSGNAFSVMMSAQRQVSAQRLPPSIEQPRNKKDELYNTLLGFLKKEQLCWTSLEVAHGVAACFVRILTDVLWFLDGHQSTLRERSCETPVVFDQFANFNRPELSKHRKRSTSSLSSECFCKCVCVHSCTCIPGDVVRSNSQRLFQHLQAGFWGRSEWQAFKHEVEILARSLQKYCDHLCAKKQRTFANHHSQEQVCSIENSLSVQFVQQQHTVSSTLQSLCEEIEWAGPDTPVSLQDMNMLPEYRKRRYEYIEAIKNGLNVPVILVTYSPGGNSVNLQWVWHTHADSINSALQAGYTTIPHKSYASSCI